MKRQASLIGRVVIYAAAKKNGAPGGAPKALGMVGCLQGKTHATYDSPVNLRLTSVKTLFSIRLEGDLQPLASPRPGWFTSEGPHTETLESRLTLQGGEAPTAEARIIPGPAGAHEICGDIRFAYAARRKRASVPVNAAPRAPHSPPMCYDCEAPAREIADPAPIRRTSLIHLRRIDAVEANALARNINRVAVDDARGTGNVHADSSRIAARLRIEIAACKSERRPHQNQERPFTRKARAAPEARHLTAHTPRPVSSIAGMVGAAWLTAGPTNRVFAR